MAVSQQLTVAFLLMCLSCTAIGTRQLKEESASSSEFEAATTSNVLTALEHFDAAEQSEPRELWVDPSIKPTSTKGFNVIISIVYQGHYTTVNTFKLRSAMAALGFSTDNSKLAFGGQNAMANYRCLTSFTMNIPTATTAQQALDAVQGITVQALSSKANLGKGYPILSVFFSTYKA